MRALGLLGLMLAACSPEIGYDTYLCGDEATCPPGQACNGPDNHCVASALAEPFSCNAAVEHDDNTVATATPIPLEGCVTSLAVVPGCLADGDLEDWYTFAVPANCTAVVAHLHIAYPLSFEEVPFALADQDGVALEESGDCGNDETSLAGLGLVDKCLKRTVTPGKTFAIHVKADPTLSCGGACAFNRYTLSLQLLLPVILHWSWQCVPYLACVVALCAMCVVTAAIRGDRVMRLGVLGAGSAALPWVVCTALAACTDDPADATRLLRLGQGPVALIGPNILLILLGVTGQLERRRWLARFAAFAGALMTALCWATPYTVPGVHKLAWGMFYFDAGPLSALHLSQLGVWLVVGIVITRRATPSQDRRRATRLLIGILAVGSLAGTDILLAYGVSDNYPLAWIPALVGCGVGIYLVLGTDLLRSQGIDRGAILELAAYAVAAIVVAWLAIGLASATSIVLALITCAIFAIVVGIAWGIAERADAHAAPTDAGALGELVAGIAESTDEDAIGERLATAWARLGIADAVIARDPMAPEVADWLVETPAPLTVNDLATMRVGPIRPALEALFAGGTTLIVPLVDRGKLLGVIRATSEHTLRDVTRGLVIESARTVARGLAFAELARAAAAKGDVAREVDLAQAMRAQSTSQRRGDDSLASGRFAIAAEYRSATRTTSAGWASAFLPDGRLVVLVTEAQAHGVPAALATAALTGTFSAATTVPPSGLDLAAIDVDTLIASLRASVGGGEPIAAFVGIVDADARAIAWASAGHRGAVVLSAAEVAANDSIGSEPRSFPTGSLDGSAKRPKLVDIGGGGTRLGAVADPATPPTTTRGTTALPADAVLVLASSELRGEDELRWQMRLLEVAGSGGAMAGRLVEKSLERGAPREDLLAVVVRVRPSIG